MLQHRIVHSAVLAFILVALIVGLWLWRGTSVVSIMFNQLIEQGTTDARVGPELFLASELPGPLLRTACLSIAAGAFIVVALGAVAIWRAGRLPLPPTPPTGRARACGGKSEGAGRRPQGSRSRSACASFCANDRPPRRDTQGTTSERGKA